MTNRRPPGGGHRRGSGPRQAAPSIDSRRWSRSDTRRSAARRPRALGRLDQNNAVPGLAGLRSAIPGPFPRTCPGLRDDPARRTATPRWSDWRTPTRRCSAGRLIALDQMEGGRLTLDLVRPSLDAAEPGLRQAALRVVAKHPEWAGQMAETLRRWLARGGRRREPGRLSATTSGVLERPDHPGRDRRGAGEDHHAGGEARSSAGNHGHGPSRRVAGGVDRSAAEDAGRSR